MKESYDARTGQKITQEAMDENWRIRNKNIAEQNRLFREMSQWDAKYRGADKKAGVEALRRIRGVLNGLPPVD